MSGSPPDAPSIPPASSPPPPSRVSAANPPGSHAVGPAPPWASAPAWSDRLGAAEPSTDADLLAGQDRYRPRDLLGRGGMGEVLVAHDTWLGRDVAIKRVRDARHLERLLAEARLAAVLEHPGIVPIHDVALSQGRPDGFYVMRLVRGRNLAQALAETSPEGRLALVPHILDACRAVAFAHKLGILHRDLKPDNLLIGELGDTQVADWGLAVPADGAEAVPGLGCPAYLSPQLARGLPPTRQDDVFALGAVLYEILAGRPPFAAPTVDRQWALARQGQVPPLRGTPSPELAAIATRATAPDPAARYASLVDLAADLERWFAGQRVHAHAYTSLDLARRFVLAFRLPLAVAGLAAVVLAVVVAAGWQRVAQERDAAIAARQHESRARAETRRQLAETLAHLAQVAVDRGDRPLAERLAQEALQAAGHPVARGVLAALGAQARPVAVPLASPPDCASLRPSPDATCSVCLQPERAVWQCGEGGGELAGPWVDVVVLPDAGRVVLASEATVTFADLAGQPIGPPHGLARAHPLVATTGTPVVAVQQAHEVTLFDTTTGAVVDRLECPDRHHVLAVALLPGGASAVAACEGNRLAWWRRGQPTRYASAPVIDQLRGVAAMAVTGGHHLVLAGIDGRLAHLPAWDTEVHFQAGGAETRPLPSSRGEMNFTLAPLPVAEVRALTAAGEDRVAVLGAVGGLAWLRLSDGAELGWAPAAGARHLAWNPATGQLHVGGTRHEAWRLTGEARPAVLQHGAGLATLDVSPDGRRVAAGSGAGDLIVWDLADGRAVFRGPACAHAVKDVQFTADGRRLWVACIGAPGLAVFEVGAGNEGGGGNEIGAGNGAPVSPSAFVPPTRAEARRAGWLRSGRVWLLDTLQGLSEGTQAPLARRPGPGFVDGETSRDGHSAVLVGPGGAVWRVTAEAPAHVLWPDAAATAVAASADGRLVAVTSGGFVRWRHLHDGTQGGFAVPGAQSQDLAVSDDGRFLAVAHLDGTVSLYDRAAGRATAFLRGHRQRVAAVVFAPGGRLLLSASWDGTVRLWAVPASWDGTVRLWAVPAIP